MRIAAIYDIHGNLPALEAVLREIEQERVDIIVVGGDIVTGPMPRATLERLEQLGQRVRALSGNCDREVVDCFDGRVIDQSKDFEVISKWTADQLSREQRDYLAALPKQLTFHVEGLGEILFCHATPRNDTEIFTVASPEARLREFMAGVSQNIVVCGHTHMQFDLRLDDLRIVNAGSVGMTYGKPGACWCLFGPQVEQRHTSYDLEAAAALVRVSGYPQAQDFADNNIVNTPSQEEAVAVFEEMANKQS